MLFRLKHFFRFTALTLSLVLVLSSCSGVSQSTDESGSASAQTSETDNTVRVTFPEGYSVSQIAAKLEKNNVCSAVEFMNEANNSDYLSQFSIDISNPDERSFLLEGYLFPDTYDFYIDESASSVIKKFLRNTDNKFSDEYRQRAAQLGYSEDEILNMAAIIQIESGGSAQAGKVASVLHNRLNSSEFKRLQCDATVSYLKNSVKPYVDESRYDELCELYNTYMCYGLPAGPITNPGITAIEAALWPEETDYYYFVTDSDGAYHYARTYEEHQSNCADAGINN